jgi:hypothetical protein
VTIVIALVLPVMVNVSGRPFVTVAVIGTINDFPAGTVTFPSGAITGAANNHPAMEKKAHAAMHVAAIRDFLVDLLVMSRRLKWSERRDSNPRRKIQKRL